MVYLFQQQLGLRLASWAGVNIAAGIILLAATHGFFDGVGLQALIWGVIDATIAVVGIASGRRWAREARTVDEAEAQLARLYRILRVNTAIDPLYITAGLLVAVIWGGRDAFILGTGWGVIVQGTFLFVFDFYHTLRLRSALPDRRYPDRDDPGGQEP